MPQLFAVIGDPIEHSLSPVIHTKIFQMIGGEERLYIPLRITPEQLPSAVEILRSNFRGFNVTIPHKQAIISLLDELTPEAVRCGAVNTVKCESGRLIGHNTDIKGFAAGFEGAGWPVDGSRALIIGAGGAARAVGWELAARGCEITIANRTVAAAEKLAHDLQKGYPELAIRAVPFHGIIGKSCDLVVNCTPVGMGELEGESPVDLEELRDVQYVYDLIYNPPQTALLRQAQELGCRVLNGLPMLVQQAALADEFWLKQPITGAMVTEVLVLLEEMTSYA
mgnify:CR=1 FL=1